MTKQEASLFSGRVARLSEKTKALVDSMEANNPNVSYGVIYSQVYKFETSTQKSNFSELLKIRVSEEIFWGHLTDKNALDLVKSFNAQFKEHLLDMADKGMFSNPEPFMFNPYMTSREVELLYRLFDRRQMLSTKKARLLEAERLIKRTQEDIADLERIIEQAK